MAVYVLRHAGGFGCSSAGLLAIAFMDARAGIRKVNLWQEELPHITFHIIEIVVVHGPRHNSFRTLLLCAPTIEVLLTVCGILHACRGRSVRERTNAVPQVTTDAPLPTLGADPHRHARATRGRLVSLSQDACFLPRTSVRVAAYRAYALSVVARETSQDFAAIAHLPIDTHLDESLGMTQEHRLRIMIHLRMVFGSQLPVAASVGPNTLRELFNDIVPAGTATNV